MRSKFDQPEHSPGFLLWQVTNAWQRAQRQALKPLELTHVQFVLLTGLVWLSKTERVITQTDLALHAKTDTMMTSQVVRALEKRNLLKRLPHPSDTRAYQLQATAKGKKLVGEAIVVVEEIDAEFFKKLGHQQKAFSQYLLKLL